MPQSSQSGDSLFEVLKAQPMHQSEAVREASEVFLLSMLNFYANFPTLAGCEQITAKDELSEETPGSPNINLASQGSGTVVDDDGDDDRLYFIYNSTSVFSFDHFERNGGMNPSHWVCVELNGRVAADLPLCNRQICASHDKGLHGQVRVGLQPKL